MRVFGVGDQRRGRVHGTWAKLIAEIDRPLEQRGEADWVGTRFLDTVENLGQQTELIRYSVVDHQIGWGTGGNDGATERAARAPVL